MANYTINYACGHDSTEKQLYGKTSERESYIEWAERNIVCPDCYKAAKKAEDAAAEKVAKICLVPAAEPIISIEVAGQIEANKDALYTLGYHWSDSTSAGLFGYFATKRPKRVLAILCKAESAEQVGAWITQQQASLSALGYSITDNLNPLDMAYLAELVQQKQSADITKSQAQALLVEIQVSDPKPKISALRNRIAELEKSSGRNWNGKIYGKKGYYNFYVANVEYNATDEEVADRDAINAARDAWNAKYKAEIEAAK